MIGAGARPLRFTERAYGAFWSPDATEIAYHTLTPPVGMQRQRLDREAPATDLPGIAFAEIAIDWSPDRSKLLMLRGPVSDVTPGRSANTDLALYDLTTGSIRTLFASPANEFYGRLSPDGHRVAYASDASGDVEVYVRSIDGSTAVPAPLGKGAYPVWRHDGRELFFLTPNDEVMAVEFAAGATEPSGPPRMLFHIPLNDITRNFFPPYDVAPDGQRFLLNVPAQPASLLYVRGLEQWLNHR